jgi:hypothetical protein
MNRHCEPPKAVKQSLRWKIASDFTLAMTYSYFAMPTIGGPPTSVRVAFRLSEILPKKQGINKEQSMDIM